jgi:hypothetical protein
MNNIELLILHGPPAAGKSSLAKAMHELLRTRDIQNAIVDLDYLANIHPLKHIGIQYRNLAAVWPNYATLGEIKIILPTYLQPGDLEAITTAAPANRTIVCEVTAPTAALEARISSREPNEFQRNRHLEILHEYPATSPYADKIDFKVLNHDTPLEAIALEVLQKTGWI